MDDVIFYKISSHLFNPLGILKRPWCEHYNRAYTSFHLEGDVWIAVCDNCNASDVYEKKGNDHE